MEDIHSKLQEIRNPIHAIGFLIREMDYETDADMERGESSSPPSGKRWEVSLFWKLFLPVWLLPHLGGFPRSSSPGAAHEPVPAVRQQHRGTCGVWGGGQDLHCPLPPLPGPAHPPAAPAAPRRSREYSPGATAMLLGLGNPWVSAGGAGWSSVSSHKAVGIARGLGRSCSLLQLLLSS